MDDLAKTITALWEARDDLESVMPVADAQHAVHTAIEQLDTGEARVAELVDDEVVVHEWLKHAVLLLFRLAHMETTELGPFEYHDKIPLKRHYDSGARARRPRSVGAMGLVPRARCDPDAELRQHRRARRSRHDGRHLGDGRVVRADRRARAPLGRRRHRWGARTGAGGAGDRSATTPRSARAAWSPRAPAWATVACSPRV